MGKPSAPAAPDYVGAATAQGAANKETAVASSVLSNPNIISPLGNQTVSYDQNNQINGVPVPTITKSLTPDAQATLDSQQGVQRALANLGLYGVDRAKGVMQQGFNPDLPNLQTGVDTSGVAKMPVNAGQTGQQALMARLQPQIQQNEQATAQRLANQGIPVGSEAWQNEMRAQGQQENDAYSQAALQGLGLDMSANQQGYNQSLQNAQFGNTAIGQSLQQQLGLYNQPLNQITALMSGSQVQMPQFQGYTGQNIQAAPLFQATQQKGLFDQNSYAQKMAGYNSMISGISGVLGGAASGGMFGTL